MLNNINVVFHEEILYFSSQSDLTGEDYQELQTLDYDNEKGEAIKNLGGN